MKGRKYRELTGLFSVTSTVPTFTILDNEMYGSISTSSDGVDSYLIESGNATEFTEGLTTLDIDHSVDQAILSIGLTGTIIDQDTIKISVWDYTNQVVVGNDFPPRRITIKVYYPLSS